MHYTFIAYYRDKNDKPCSKVIRLSEQSIKLYRSPLSGDERLWERALWEAMKYATKHHATLVFLSRTELNKPFSESKGIKELLQPKDASAPDRDCVTQADGNCTSIHCMHTNPEEY